MSCRLRLDNNYPRHHTLLSILEQRGKFACTNKWNDKIPSSKVIINSKAVPLPVMDSSMILEPKVIAARDRPKRPSDARTASSVDSVWPL
jgi:hypothetical protein